MNAAVSFSSEVRKELCDSGTHALARHCQLAELLGIINISGEVGPGRVSLLTENPWAAQRFNRLVSSLFQLETQETAQKNMKILYVNGEPSATRVLKAIGCMAKNGTVRKNISPQAVMDACCKRAYIRGSFIAGGSLSDPSKNYHLEFTYPPPDGPGLAEGLCRMLQTFDLKPKTMARKTHAVVYVKESESIVDTLNIMEAHKCLLQFENIRVVKEMRNSVNRKVNFETANLNKTVGAAVGQIEDIRYIASRTGLGYLSKPLEEVARLRLQYESATLKEIGRLLSIPVGKSGVNHRLRKISEIAAMLRREEEAINL